MSSTSTPAKLSTLKLQEALKGADNWTTWRTLVLDWAAINDAEGHITAGDADAVKPVVSSTSPVVTADQVRTWEKIDRQVLANMRRWVDPAIMINIQSAVTAIEAWERLLALYQTTDIISLIQTRRKFFSQRMDEGGEITDHMQTMQGLFDKLRSIHQKHASSFDWAITLAALLPASWDNFVQNLQVVLADLADDTKHDEVAQKVKSMILAEGQRRKENTNEEQALAARFEKYKAKQNSYPSSSTPKQEDKKPGTCNYCKKAGHWMSECRKKIKDDKWKDRKEGKKANIAETANKAEAEPKEEEEEVYYASMADHLGEQGKDPGWLVDSGANCHFVANKISFSSYRLTPNQRVRGVSGTTPIIGRGDVPVVFTSPKGNRTTVLLKNCAHVPTFQHNLISVTKFDDNGIRTHFGGGQAVLTKDDIVFGYATRPTNGLYEAIITTKEEPDFTTALEASHVAKPQTWQQLHNTLAHTHQKAIETLVKLYLDEFNVINSPKDYQCEACIQGKLHVSAHPRISRTKHSRVRELVVTDVWGKAQLRSLQGSEYFVSFTDMYSRFSRVYFLKSTKEVRDVYKHFEAMVQTQTNNRILCVRSDGGKEYINKELQDYVATRGTLFERTAPHSSAQNGVAERLNRTLLDFARTMLHGKQLPKYLWQDAVAHAAYVRNRLPTKATGRTPYEMFFGRAPKYTALEEFGSEIWVLDQSGKARKLDPRARKFKFVGFGDESRAYRYWKPDTRQVLLSRNVVFVKGEAAAAPIPQVDDDSDEDDDEVLPFRGGVGPSPSAPAPVKKEELVLKGKEKQPATPPPPKPVSQPPPRPKKPAAPRFVQPQPVRRTSRATIRHNYKRLNQEGLPVPDEAPVVVSIPNEQLPVPLEESTLSEDDVDESLLGLCEIEREWEEMAYKATSNPHDQDHPTYEETLKRWDADEWSKARDDEMAVFQRMGTFRICDAPSDVKIMTPKWVNVAKRNNDNDIARRKARLVLRGFAQRPGIDFDAVFAHVLRSDSLRTLFALAATHDWDIYGLDVISAFLNGKADKQLFMRQIPGYEDGTNRVLEVIGSLYGMRQAPNIWYKLFFERIQTLGYKRLPSEHSIFMREKNGDIVILAVYVDDIAVFSTAGTGRKAQQELMTLFEMRDLGELTNFLGYQIIRDRRAGTIKITQERYIKSIIDRMGLGEANPVRIPMAAGTQLKRYEGPRIDYPYATKIGELLYAALGTFPEISYAVQHLSQFTSNPGPEHIAGVKQIYRYLKGTADYGITYTGSMGSMVTAYSDADWGQSILDRKSISGHVFVLAGGAVSWTSKKQATVALSTLEGEYVALSLAIRHALWMRQLLTDLGLPPSSPTPVFTDSKSAIALTKDAQFHARSKHIDVRHHFIRDICARGDIVVDHIPGDDNPADLFTKALARPRIEGLLDKFKRRQREGSQLVQALRDPPGLGHEDGVRPAYQVSKAADGPAVPRSKR